MYFLMLFRPIIIREIISNPDAIGHIMHRVVIGGFFLIHDVVYEFPSVVQPSSLYHEFFEELLGGGNVGV